MGPIERYSEHLRSLRMKARTDMVLPGPSVTDDGNVNAKVLNRLVKTASRPVVTMAKQAQR